MGPALKAMPQGNVCVPDTFYHLRWRLLQISDFKKVERPCVCCCMWLLLGVWLATLDLYFKYEPPLPLPPLSIPQGFKPMPASTAARAETSAPRARLHGVPLLPAAGRGRHGSCAGRTKAHVAGAAAADQRAGVRCCFTAAGSACIKCILTEEPSAGIRCCLTAAGSAGMPRTTRECAHASRA